MIRTGVGLANGVDAYTHFKYRYQTNPRSQRELVLYFTLRLKAASAFTVSLPQVVNYESPRGSVSVLKEEDNVSRSSLIIHEAQPSDTGNYTCSPSNADGTSLRVHVFSGDPPAAMQTNGGVALLAPPFGHAFYTCLVGGLFLTLLTEDLLLPGTFRGGGEA
ncbi:uncharacterized protein LOC125043077 [Penaeus chinensis]|uniref:uncharacterized protein LOC125043077 n=1 Tax=Penaeus chinensis TaxID=139456 RepID=UPI001FB5DBF7|nr:uncharacterized protein LOC125043077 [Penaeus chinensis]